MCGIVGLLVKKAELREQLGAMMVPMLVGMSERGPDSAGLAEYTEPAVAGVSLALLTVPVSARVV